ncbi:MAG: TetR/AcrR family transcriptional regulator [Dehalococcoidia bacterium]
MDETEERILDAAARVFAETGFRGATTRRIAEAAGVNEVTLFRRFPTKDALIVAALRHASDRTIAALAARALPAQPRDVRGELSAYATIVLEGVLASRQAHRTALGEWGHNPSLDRYLLLTTAHVYDEVHRYVVHARDAGLLRAEVDPLVGTQLLLGALLGDALMRDVMPDYFPRTPAATVPAYLDVLLAGLTPATADRTGDTA